MNAIKRFLCRLGWHSWIVGYEYLPPQCPLDVVNIHARCKWCHYEGILDSQGGLF